MMKNQKPAPSEVINQGPSVFNPARSSAFDDLARTGQDIEPPFHIKTLMDKALNELRIHHARMVENGRGNDLMGDGESLDIVRGILERLHNAILGHATDK